ncbi:hypothetical protein ACHAXS_014100 [Conticribra weissflogii]
MRKMIFPRSSHLLQLFLVMFYSIHLYRLEAFSTPRASRSASRIASNQFPSHIKRHENDPKLLKLQSKHRQIASSFVPSKFNPPPILRNNHLQSIFGVFLRKIPECAYFDSSIRNVAGIVNQLSQVNPFSHPDERHSDFWDERQRIQSECSEDFFNADIKYAGVKEVSYHSHGSKGLVVLIHGLESNSNSSIASDIGTACIEKGFDVVCLNFRGCCGSPNDTLGGYHLGFTNDLRHFLNVLKQSQITIQKVPIYLSGFSLGANVVVKCLGELGSKAYTDFNIVGAAVTGAPFDAERVVGHLDSPGINRSFYSKKFLQNLKQRARAQLERHCKSDPFTSKFDYLGAMGATSIRKFEDAYTSKIYGFESSADYYHRNSCYYFLKAVAVPLFILNAGDDPFFDPDFFPIEESVDGGAIAPIKMERTQYGGHLGFMFHQLSEEEKKIERKSSWMPMELARFVNHVHTCNNERVGNKNFCEDNHL